MHLKTTTLIVLVSALVGAFTATFFKPSSGEADTTALTARIAELESQISTEVLARQRVESTLMQFAAQADASLLTTDDASDDLPSDFEALTSEDAENFDDESVQIISEPRNTPLSAAELRRQTLVAGGFTADEANWVASQEEQAELEQLFAQHRLQREALAEDSAQMRAWQQRSSQNDALRSKLGEDYYERYLEANGWPTTADVRSVIKGSPADLAGLQAGDKIRSYAGERVFNMRDVSRLTLEGQEGETVLVEVERDGTVLQVTIPRGPVGISSSNYRFRR